MLIPKRIGPILPNGDQLNGLIARMKKYVKNPITSGLISLQATDLFGKREDVIMWNGDYATTYDAYIEIQFKKGKICPRNYSIRGVSISLNWYYAKKWELYGYNEENKANKKSWSLLNEGTSSSSTFCGNGQFCSGRGISTHPIDKNVGRCFSFLRFITITSSGNMHVTTSGMELYGTYKEPSFSCCICSRPKVLFIISVFLINEDFRSP